MFKLCSLFLKSNNDVITSGSRVGGGSPSSIGFKKASECTI